MFSSDHRLGIGLALGAAFFFGLSHSVVVLAYTGGSNPLSVSTTRFILPILALLGFLLARRSAVVLPWRQGIRAFGLGFVTAAYTLSLLLALDDLPAGIAMLVFYLFPLFTGVIVAVAGRTSMDRRMIGAAVVALLGLALTLGVRLEHYSIAGLALAAFAALGLAIVSALSRPVIAASDPLRATIYMSAGALFALLLFVAVAGGFQWPESQAGWAGFLLSHVFFAVAVTAYFMAIGLVGAPTAATLGNLQPLVVITVAWLLLGQSLTPLQLLGAAIVVGALVMAARR